MTSADREKHWRNSVRYVSVPVGLYARNRDGWFRLRNHLAPSSRAFSGGKGYSATVIELVYAVLSQAFNQ